ncbi:hypothetical protein MMAD_45340 [Mycolicibacterium madagascariense]|uniref:Glyoxalase n=1 Tax=Mycolicibacterium madagascariense TaxID=212765 RepID=A0A7I7XLY2_9MYCO|nr:VOC family protein [Mycolicibacterium madagascariense]MCV7012558.1 glyoxalase [Mycolicibacterium madagascariense]BBZ30239.1 hypothetical protein MMAD_45340 [Mycolicibacterium madagascariense]
MSLTVTAIDVGDPAQAWTSAGFTVESPDLCRVGGVAIRPTGRGAGILGWSLRGLPDGSDTTLDGIPTLRADPDAGAPGTHPNGVLAIDHVVLLSPHLDRTLRAFAGVGAQPRRHRDAEIGGRGVRQVFFRFGEVIVEVVGSPDAADDGPSHLWGITYVVADVDATAAFYGDRATRVKDAVQPGRRIMTLHHREYGMSVRTAFISAPILGP